MTEKGPSSMAVKRCFAVSVVIQLRGQYDDRILSEEAWGRGALIGAMGTTIVYFSCLLSESWFHFAALDSGVP